MSADLFHFDDDKPNFESLAKENGFTYWYASELMQMLGYATMESFKKAINKAIAGCASLNIDISENFKQEGQDFKLSRFACYLVTMNSDPRKQEVAKAQAFFATIAEAFRKFVQESSDVERVLIRDEITTQEKSLSSQAKHSGVENFAFFKDKGYRGMYNMGLKQIKQMKGVEENKNLYDYMGREEMAANLFRLTQTEAKLERQGYMGQKGAEQVAYDVGKTVRDTMIQLSGNRPENLPSAQDIKKVKSALKSSQKDFAKIDSKKRK